MAQKIPSSPSNLESKTGNSQSLRVLIVEDSEDDALLIIRELKKGGYNPVYERVETAAAMKKALKEKQWDIILCDYRLPKFNAPLAIALLKEANIDIPLIIVSGTIGEETAVECMRLGAHDYIMKNSLSRLCPAIARELEEAKIRNKQRQAESALHQSEEKYRNLVERASDGIGIAQDGTIRYANTRLAQIGGYSVHELIGKPFIDFFIPEEVPKVLDRYKRRIAGKKVAPVYETALRHNNGSRIDVEVNAGIITYQGKPADLVLVRDITERKRADESLREKQEAINAIFETSHEWIWAIDNEGKHTYSNLAIEKILGYRLDEIIGYSSLDLLHEEDKKLVDSILLKARRKKHGWNNLLLRWRHKNGTYRQLESNAVPILNSEGDLLGFRGVDRDITERKQAEEALQESEENFRFSLDDSPLGVRIATAEGETLYANRTILDIYGYDSIDELKGIPLKKRYTQKSYAEFRIRKGKRERGEIDPSEYEISIVRKNGEVRHVRVFRKQVLWNGARQFQIIYQDITERKQAEEELYHSQRMLQLVLDNIPQRVFWKDRNYVYLGCNKSFLQDAELTSPKEIIGKNDFQLSWKKTASLYRADDKEVMKNNMMKVGYEEPQDKPDGSQMWLRTSKTPLHDRDGHVIGILGTYEDITEQKRAEEILKESEERFRLAFENANTGVCLVDLEGNLTMVNNKMCEIFGYTKEELEHMTVNDIAYPEDIDKSPDFIQKSLHGKIGSDTFEKRYFHKKRHIVTCEVSSSLVRKADGSPLYFISHIHDLTNRKKAEEALRESEERYRRIVDNSLMGMGVSCGNQVIFANPALLRLFGYNNLEEFTKIPLLNHVAPASRELIVARMEKIAQGKPVPDEFEYDILQKDGVTKTLLASSQRFTLGGKVYTQTIFQDTTERKQAESQREAAIEELRKSEEKYRTILESIEEGYYEAGLAGNLTFFNNSVCRISGYSREESMGMNNKQYTDEYNAKKIFQAFNEVYRTEKPTTGYEYEIIRKDGAKAYVAASISLRKDSAGKKIGFRGIIRDITERKQADEALRKSEERMKSVFRAAPIGIGLLVNRVFIDVNDRISEMIGYSREELIGASARVLYPTQADFDYVGTEKYRQIAQEGTGSVETRWRKKDGKIIDILLSSSPLDLSDLSRGVTFTALDITERKQAQEKIQQSEEKYRLTFASTSDVIFTLDAELKISSITPSVEKILGYKPEELVNKSFPDLNLVTPESLARAIFNVKQVLSGIDIPITIYEFITKDGVKGIGEVTGSPIIQENKIIGVTCVARDITERKQAEEELSKRSEELQTIIESSPIMIYFKDTENRFLRVNKAVLETSGLAKEEIEGKSNEEINPSEAAKLREEDKEIVATGLPKIGILETIKTRRGSKILQTDKVPYKDKEGNIIGIIGFSVDITEQKKAQEELLKSEEKYRSLVENALEGIFQSTAEGRHLTINPAFAHMLGYDSPAEVMATVKDIAKQLYVKPDDREKLLELVKEKGSVTDFETEFYKKDGSRIWVSVNMYAVRDDQGRILYYQGIDQDITEKKKIEAERQESIERLRKSLGATINAMAITVETRDPYTAGHQRRVADLARAIAVEINLKSEQIDGVRMASMIHDIGKISIPSEILTKPTQLTNLEFNLIKTHPVSGHNILKDIEFPWPIARIVLEHHERIDGSGYPNGLAGEQILLESRIIAIADVVEAISSHRPYRAAYGVDVALDEITKNKGTLYDPELVDACLRLFREKNYNLTA